MHTRELMYIWLLREQKYQHLFNNTIELMHKDALTGVKNQYAYIAQEDDLNNKIAHKKINEFAIIVCDVNNLKHINDTAGHSTGNTVLQHACKTICNIFKHSPVFRIGGDEFAVLLLGHDYWKRDELIAMLSRTNDENYTTYGFSIAHGMSEFIPSKDSSVSDVFKRADVLMYENKEYCKQLHNN